ncbi:unnamed protein product [Lupinus luteus]|uniref:Uncharacterized protein n=1 Tax=Lupinus luteus TaxID=3873 RepID=A0AAV1XXB1_LUPLU
MGKGRAPCCDKTKVKRGPWSPEEDLKLIAFIHKNGHENWRAVPKQADESKMESSITSSSSSESFSTNEEPNLAKTIPNSESNEQALQVTMNEKIEHDSEKHVSNEVISIIEDPKDSSTSVSFVESNILNSNHIATFTPEQQLCSPLTYLGPYDIDSNNINNTLQEVDKPNHLIEIPWDSDEDFWKLIDNFESLQSSEVQIEGDPSNQTPNHVQESVQDGENMKWPHEFGVVGETNESNKDQFLPKNYAAELGLDPYTFDLDVMEKPESELDLRNIQLWLMA